MIFEIGFHKRDGQYTGEVIVQDHPSTFWLREIFTAGGGA